MKAVDGVRTRNLERKRAQTERVKAATSKAVVKAAKKAALERRLKGEELRQEEQIWVEERARNEEAHLQKARKNKSGAMTTRSNARVAKAACLTERKVEAAKERSNDHFARDAKKLLLQTNQEAATQRCEARPLPQTRGRRRKLHGKRASRRRARFSWQVRLQVRELGGGGGVGWQPADGIPADGEEPHQKSGRGQLSASRVLTECQLKGAGSWRAERGDCAGRGDDGGADAGCGQACDWGGVRAGGRRWGALITRCCVASAGGEQRRAVRRGARG